MIPCGVGPGFRVTSLALSLVLGMSWLSGCKRTISTREASQDAAPLPVVCLGYADIEGGAAALRPDRPGRVVSVEVREGDDVEAHQELLKLEDGEERQEVARATAGLRLADLRETQARQDAQQHPTRMTQATASLQATNSRLAGAQAHLRRQEDLLGRSLISQSEVDVARERVRELEASVEAARAHVGELKLVDPSLPVRMAESEVSVARTRLEQARIQLTGRVLRAPTAGRVLTLAARPGEVVGQPGGEVPVLFAPRLPFIVRAEVEQERAGNVRVGQPVQVRDEITGMGPWDGTVERVGTVYRRRKHRTDPREFADVPTIECIVRLSTSAPMLRIGQKLRVTMQ